MGVNTLSILTNKNNFIHIIIKLFIKASYNVKKHIIIYILVILNYLITKIILKRSIYLKLN